VQLYHIQFSLNHEKYHYIKDGLAAYRNITQTANVSSLENVLKKYLETVEKEFSATIKNIQNPSDFLKEIEEEENPEDLFLNVLENKMDKIKEDVSKKWKLLMEAYRTELELIYKNKNLEEMYINVARRALQRCKKFNKRGDFKKLCEVIRVHQYQNVKASEKTSTTNPAFALNIKNPETNDRLMDLRFNQLIMTKEMGLWQDAYKIMEDINVLLKNRRKTPNDILLKYYQHLYEIFWHSNHYLLHAVGFHNYFACLRRKSEEKDQQKYVNHLVLAALSIPIGQIDEMSNPDFFRKNCNLINSAGQIMTREQLITNLKNGPYLDLCNDDVRALFTLITECKDILQFSKRTESLFKTLKQNPEFEKYLPMIEQNIIVGLVDKLSSLYKSMSFATFKKILGFLDFSKCEKYLLSSQHSSGSLNQSSAASQGSSIVSGGSAAGARAQIDYEKGMLIFTHDQAYGDRSSGALVDFSNNISVAEKQVQRAKMLAGRDQATLEKECLKNAVLQVEQADEIIKRKKEEASQKAANAKNPINQQREAILRKKEQEEEERKNMMKQQKEHQEIDMKSLQIVMERVKSIVKMDKNAMYKGKKLEAFTESDYANMTIEICMEIEAEIRERRQKAEEEKLEKQFKNRDYLERQIRQKRLEILKKSRDTAVLDTEAIRKEALKAHEARVALRDQFKTSAAFIKAFKDKVDKARVEKFNNDVKEYRSTLTNLFSKTIIETALKSKKTEEEKRQKEAEDRAKHELLEQEREKRREEKREEKGGKTSTAPVALSRNTRTAQELQNDPSSLAAAAAGTGFGERRDDKKPAGTGVVLGRGTQSRAEAGTQGTTLAQAASASGKSDLAKAMEQGTPSSKTIAAPIQTNASGLIARRGEGLKAANLAPTPAPTKPEEPASKPLGRGLTSLAAAAQQQAQPSNLAPMKKPESDLRQAAASQEQGRAIGRGLLSNAGFQKPAEPKQDKPEDKKMGRGTIKG